MKTERSRARRPSGTSAQPPPSLGDVATRAGTSSASVSRALNAPTLVSEALRRRVLEAASALGYFPNRSGHALAAGKSGLVGMIVPSDQPLDGPVLNAFRQRLQEAGKALLLETSRGAHDDLECVRRLLSWGVEGVAFTGTGAEAASECLRQRAVPGVLCGAEQPNWACVVFDWPGAGAMLARYQRGWGIAVWRSLRRTRIRDRRAQSRLASTTLLLPPGSVRRRSCRERYGNGNGRRWVRTSRPRDRRRFFVPIPSRRRACGPGWRSIGCASPRTSPSLLSTSLAARTHPRAQTSRRFVGPVLRRFVAPLQNSGGAPPNICSRRGMEPRRRRSAFACR